MQVLENKSVIGLEKSINVNTLHFLISVGQYHEK